MRRRTHVLSRRSCFFLRPASLAKTGESMGWALFEAMTVAAKRSCLRLEKPVWLCVSQRTDLQTRNQEACRTVPLRRAGGFYVRVRFLKPHRLLVHLPTILQRCVCGVAVASVGC